MSPSEQHHFFEALKVTEREQKVIDLLLDLVFARIKQRNEALHAEALNHFAQLLVYVRLYRLRILVENRGVNQFVLFGRLELHAVRVAEGLDHRVKVRVEDNFLQASHHLVEIIIILVPRPVVSHFEVLLVIVFTFDQKFTAFDDVLEVSILLLWSRPSVNLLLCHLIACRGFWLSLHHF